MILWKIQVQNYLLGLNELFTEKPINKNISISNENKLARAAFSFARCENIYTVWKYKYCKAHTFEHKKKEENYDKPVLDEEEIEENDRGILDKKSSSNITLKKVGTRYQKLNFCTH